MNDFFIKNYAKSLDNPLANASLNASKATIKATYQEVLASIEAKMRENEENTRKAAEKSAEGYNSYWSARAKKKKLQAEIEQLIHQKREAVQEINEEVALMRKAVTKQNAIIAETGTAQNAPELPIIGVPARFLLAGVGVWR